MHFTFRSSPGGTDAFTSMTCVEWWTRSAVATFCVSIAGPSDFSRQDIIQPCVKLGVAAESVGRANDRVRQGNPNLLQLTGGGCCEFWEVAAQVGHKYNATKLFMFARCIRRTVYTDLVRTIYELEHAQ